jgi:hypothetical protein
MRIEKKNRASHISLLLITALCMSIAACAVEKKKAATAAADDKKAAAEGGSGGDKTTKKTNGKKTSDATTATTISDHCGLELNSSIYAMLHLDSTKTAAPDATKGAANDTTTKDKNKKDGKAAEVDTEVKVPMILEIVDSGNLEAGDIDKERKDSLGFLRDSRQPVKSQPVLGLKSEGSPKNLAGIWKSFEIRVGEKRESKKLSAHIKDMKEAGKYAGADVAEITLTLEPTKSQLAISYNFKNDKNEEMSCSIRTEKAKFENSADGTKITMSELVVGKVEKAKAATAPVTDTSKTTKK